MPLFHIGGIVPMLGVFSVGAKFCTPATSSRGSPSELDEERATVIDPTFETTWLQCSTTPTSTTRPSAIRLIHNIGVPERLKQLEARMPWAVQVAAYGAPSARERHLHAPEGPLEPRMTTLGRPIEGMQVKITDVGPAGARGRRRRAGFRGYALFEGYYKDPEQDRAGFDADG